MLPSAHDGSSLDDFSTLKMEAIRSSETSVHIRSTQRHVPEDGILKIFMLSELIFGCYSASVNVLTEPPMPVRSKGRVQAKRESQVLQDGGWAWS
jgi:hypothetical protein